MTDLLYTTKEKELPSDGGDPSTVRRVRYTIDTLSIPQEAASLKEFLSEIENKSKSLTSDPRDKDLFNKYIQLTSVNIGNLEKSGFSNKENIRRIIRYHLHSTVLALYLKHGPHFLKDSQGNEIPDNRTHLWTPGFYRIEPALPTIAPLIADQDILDPFAGSGSFMHAFSALGIPRTVTCGDICYIGGRPILPETDWFYNPIHNCEQFEAVYNSLPDTYRPHLSQTITGYVTHDAASMGFQDKAFDWIVSDPPYGISHQPGGVDYFASMVPEMMRVVRQGGIFIVPLDWNKQLEKQGIVVVELTGEVVPGNMQYPSGYIKIPAV